ncbi:RagB/SusD family nutrient uptake outer membrane protein [Flavicella sp.]|uniref:RagB/SusD family nutrient uptake outer membrane protein n=1 Tax=Flavicella sp. TaxID=2957742 RepID=UPI00261A9DDF|nr:RagB/SusD family nutrient uptake outer membrane protein [Flavicella sp.]MDG1803552.1 RagB/SusD family nutrient uptake outer membrane protein [Flavicella sp.]
MRQLISKYTLLLLTLGFLNSCEITSIVELDQENPNLISTDTYWTNLNETGATLNTVYQTLHRNDLLHKFEEILRSDMGYPGYGRPNPTNTEESYLHLYTASSEMVLGKWQNCYLGIFRANQVIEALKGLELTFGDLPEYKSQMAQARFFRGLFHFYLTTSYNNGSIIIRDKVPVTSEDFAKGLSSKQEVLDFLRADLEFAYDNLYKNGEYPDGDLSRATSGAAATILGTSYLYELDYTTAMTYFSDVIQNHGYSLETDLSKMFTTAGEFNSESIFEINFAPEQARLDLAPWEGDSGTNWVNVRTAQTKSAVAPAWAVNAYKTEPMDPLNADNYYIDQNGSTALRTVPLRCSSIMAVIDDNETIYYQDGTTSQYGRFGGANWGYGWWKIYTNDDIVSTEGELPGGQAYSSKNIVLNRLSDVFLMQAECLIKTGDVDSALELINDIRKRWGLVLLGMPNGDVAHTYDELPYDQNSLMQHLMRVEKPLETSVEGHNIRFLDFQRWKKSDNYGFKDRLGELATSVFYGVNISYYNWETEQVATRNNNSSVVATQPTSGFYLTVDYEYNTPFLNYSEDKHGTFPIPFDETSTNRSID